MGWAWQITPHVLTEAMAQGGDVAQIEAAVTDHSCYLVDGHLHFPHDGHCDDHGPVEVVKN